VGEVHTLGIFKGVVKCDTLWDGLSYGDNPFKRRPENGRTLSTGNEREGVANLQALKSCSSTFEAGHGVAKYAPIKATRPLALPEISGTLSYSTS